MTLKTYNKRFDLPVHFLSILFNAIVRGRNGQWYNITLNKRGDPVARNINDQFNTLYGGEIFKKDQLPAKTSIRHKLSPDLQKALIGDDKPSKPIKFT